MSTPKRTPVLNFPTLGVGLGALADREDPVTDELAKAARRRSAIMTLRDLDRLSEPQGQTAATPQPSSTGEVIALSQEARAAASDLARHANERAEIAEDRRIEAEERANGSFQAGQAEANSVWTKFTDITKGYQDTILTLVQANHKAQVEALQQRQNDVLTQINEQVKAAIAAKDTIIAAREESIKALSGQVQTLSQRETVEQALTGVLMSEDPTNHPLVKRIKRLAGDGKSVEEINAQLIEDQANLHMDRERNAFEAEKEERARKAQADKRVDQVLDAVTGFVTDARQYVPRLVTGIVGQKPPVQAPAGWAPQEAPQ